MLNPKNKRTNIIGHFIFSKRKNPNLLVLLFLLFFSCSNKTTTLFHNIYLGYEDERPIVIDLWNNNKNKKLIRETVDKKGRVVKIEFLRDGKAAEFGYFPISVVTYEYSNNLITETAYDKNGNYINVEEHSAHYKSIYHLDQNNFIIKIERFSDFEIRSTIYSDYDISPPTKEDLEEISKEYFFIDPKDEPLEIEFYKYSFSKLNGLYPVSKNYVIDKNYKKRYPKYWLEQGIEEGVKKLRNSASKN